MQITTQDTKRYAGWYNAIREEIIKRFDDPELFIDLLAAMSPRCQVKRNWRLAVKVYREYKSGHGVVLDDIMATHRPNVMRALRREPLSGPKVKAFAENLKGNSNCVTVDVWVCRAFGVDHKKFDYVDIENRIRELASEYGLAPAEYQAVIWQLTRQAEGKRAVSFMAAIDDERQMTLWGN